MIGEMIFDKIPHFTRKQNSRSPRSKTLDIEMDQDDINVEAEEELEESPIDRRS